MKGIYASKSHPHTNPKREFKKRGSENMKGKRNNKVNIRRIASV